jgi:hypothetical protein
VSAAHSPALRRLGRVVGDTLGRPPGPLNGGARAINLSHGMRRPRFDGFRKKIDEKGSVGDGRRASCCCGTSFDVVEWLERQASRSDRLTE